MQRESTSHIFHEYYDVTTNNGGHVRTDEDKSGGQSWLAKLDTMDLADGRALMMIMSFNVREIYFNSNPLGFIFTDWLSRQ